MGKERVFETVDDIDETLADIAQEMWEKPELGFREERSAQLLQETLEAEGFAIEAGHGGMPTAFVATYGSGEPTIGILGEYDALPALSQRVATERDPREEGAPGHGCGHNLLGTAGVGAAIAIKRAMEADRLDGTIAFFGCPAEEHLAGKVYMAREGAFDDLDVALTWHPGDLTRPQWDSSLALDSIKFTFEGTAAHAAISPESGRSALDGVQLMNSGVEYMREHVPDEVRIHYSISNGGTAPNVVPAEATVWYFVRGSTRKQVEDVSAWLGEIATGAASMTRTDVERRFLTGCYDLLPNHTVTETVWENMQTIDRVSYNDADRELAAELQATLEPEDIRETVENLPSEARELAEDASLLTRPVERVDNGTLAGSSDVGDVSWIVPTAWFYATTYPVGTPGHSWQAVVSNGSFGLETVTYAAKVLAGTAVDLLSDPERVAAAWDEFEAETMDDGYQSPLPDDAEPPFELSQE